MRSSSTCRKAAARQRSLPCLVVALALCALQTARAMDPRRDVSQYIHDVWGSDQGFPGGPVYDIAQTTDGYLWLGTEKGLVRFDGVTFRVVQPTIDGQPALRAVLGLTADAEGNLWVRLSGPTLLRYRANGFVTVKPDNTSADALVTAMTRGRDGRLLASSMATGTIRDAGGRFDVLAIPSLLPKSVVISIADTPSGDVWLGTRDAGLVNLRSGRVPTIVQGLPDKKVNSLLPDQHGALWVGTDKGVVKWTGSSITSSGVPAALANVQALAMLEDRDSNIWIGTAAGAILRVSDGVVSELAPLGARRRGSVTALFEDRDRNLWVASARGLERVRDSAFVTYSRGQGLPSDNVGPVHVDGDGRVWFAPSEGGIALLDKGRVETIHDRELARDVVYSIGGRGRDIWVGRQRGGLTRLRHANGAWSATTYTKASGLAQDSVYAVHETRAGAIWAGTLSGGASVFRDGRLTTYTTGDGLASNTITAIADAPDGSVWFGTPNGISSLVNDRWRNYSTADGLPSNDVACIDVDSNGAVWIGTANGLAALVNGRVHVPRGLLLPQEPIVGVSADAKGSIWMASAAHVLRVPRARLLQQELVDDDVREYGSADGLESTEGVRRHRSLLADTRGRVWVSLARGLSMSDTTRTQKSVPALAHIETVAADGRLMTIADNVRIAAGRQRLAFTYTGLSFAMPERVRFRYRLDGFDSDWSSPVAGREAVYTNLGPGPYRFRVMASNGEGEWSPNEAGVALTIDPRFYQTVWFQLGCTAAIVLGSAGLYRLRMHQVARRLNIRFEERLAERTRIAQDLHDTLLQGFVSASMQLHVAAEHVPPELPARASLDRVLQLMGRVIDEGRNAVRGLRAPATSADDLEQAFCAIVQELGLREHLGVRVTVEGRPRALHPVIRDEVYRIGREAIVNAVRHSAAKTIDVEIAYTPAHVGVMVRDDGCGIDDRVLRMGREGHWGLSGMRERAERIGARLKVSSRAAAGTEVELLVPGRIAFSERAE